MEYELLFFTSVANERIVETIKKDLVEILTSLGGKISGEFTDIGKRKLAYPIKRNTHAFYSFVHFELEDKQNIPEITKRMYLYDKIMRHLVIRADEVGKAIGAVEIKSEEAARTKLPKEEIRKRPEAKLEKAETKPKAALSELDEKLSEILEETPS